MKYQAPGSNVMIIYNTGIPQHLTRLCVLGGFVVLLRPLRRIGNQGEQPLITL